MRIPAAAAGACDGLTPSNASTSSRNRTKPGKERVLLIAGADVHDAGDAAWIGPQHDDAIGQEHGLVHVVGDEHGSAALPAHHPRELFLQPQPGQRIQRAKRLIEQQEARLVHQRPRDGNPLRHAARKLRRPGAREAGESHQIELFRHQPPAFVRRPAAAPQR